MYALLVELEQKVTMLSPDERAHLAEVLLESLRDTSLVDIETEWEREFESRVAAFDRGELPTYPAEASANQRHGRTLQRPHQRLGQTDPLRLGGRVGDHPGTLPEYLQPPHSTTRSEPPGTHPGSEKMAGGKTRIIR